MKHDSRPLASTSVWTAEMATDKHCTAQISPLWLDHYQTSSILIVSPKAYVKAAAVQD